MADTPWIVERSSDDAGSLCWQVSESGEGVAVVHGYYRTRQQARQVARGLNGEGV